MANGPGNTNLTGAVSFVTTPHPLPPPSLVSALPAMRVGTKGHRGKQGQTAWSATFLFSFLLLLLLPIFLDLFDLLHQLLPFLTDPALLCPKVHQNLRLPGPQILKTIKDGPNQIAEFSPPPAPLPPRPPVEVKCFPRETLGIIWEVAVVLFQCAKRSKYTRGSATKLGGFVFPGAMAAGVPDLNAAMGVLTRGPRRMHARCFRWRLVVSSCNARSKSDGTLRLGLRHLIPCC